MIWRVEVRPAESDPVPDPVASSVKRHLAELGVDGGDVVASRIYLLQTDAPRDRVEEAARTLLADAIVESVAFGDERPATQAAAVLEVHLKPGVTDPIAASTEMALRDRGIDAQVRTGRSYRFSKSVQAEALRTLASRYLANAVIEKIVLEPYLPESFETPRLAPFEIRHVAIRDLDDAALTKLSRDGHLFLNLTEMKAVQAHYREKGREPTDIELETLAQTWSEHCVHKTLKSAVEVIDATGEVVRRYKNLIKETIFGATMELIDTRRSDDFCLSVFKDNAGVIAFDATDAVCFKVETHNRPSAIEPYGGAATGVGGCIRDVMGTGLGARPIANTDVFCVAHPRDRKSLPRGVIHPRRILEQVVAGVRDYGNRMGIPTVNGAVYFDDNYIGNPLVYCGCVGIIPRDKIQKAARPGDAIVVIGGRTGRDGIHGATFSSAELTTTHADEFSHAVQIGNAITQKRMMDVLLQTRDQNLYTAVTDCGAGGLSSAVGEMGAELGAEVDLEKSPLKYAGLRYDEIWISEAQERMVLSVPLERVDQLLKLASDENVEASVIGRFGTPERELILRYQGTEVGRMSMDFVHDGIPMPTRRAKVVESKPGAKSVETAPATIERLLTALAHPNVASKHWIIRQYDHEVQGGSVIKPLVGPMQLGPADASVIRPKLGSNKGVVVSCGLRPDIEDAYQMALSAIDEAIRNAVCVGARLDTLAILDNFCWPGVHDEDSMGTLVRACEGCRDGSLGYGIPFISGKDSLHNQFTDADSGRVIRIPRTLLISAIGVIDDVSKCVTSNFKSGSNHVYRIVPAREEASLVDRRATHEVVSNLIAAGAILSCHDVSDGGTLVAVAEMCIGSGLGVTMRPGPQLEKAGLFSQYDSGYIVEVATSKLPEFNRTLERHPNVRGESIGQTMQNPRLILWESKRAAIEWPVEELVRAWRGTLDW